MLDTAVALWPPAVDAADPYPAAPINLYIGSAPAGSTDAMGRVLARSLGRELGQPVVVHNTPGAGGAVMAEQLRHAPADGYHIGMAISHAYSGNPVVQPESTSFTVADFNHLASVSKGQCALVTHAGQPYESLEDLVAAARRGEQPVFASQSPLTRIVADYIASVAGVRFRVITVQGGGETMQAILGRHADFGFSGGPHIDFVESGQMRVLAAAEDERLATSPDVPTLRELGYDISSCAMFVVSVPVDLPEPVAQTLAAALERAIASDEMQALIRNLRLPAFYLGPEAVTRALEQEAATLARAVAELGQASTAGRELSPRFMPYVASGMLLLSLALITIGRLRAPAVSATGSAALPARSDGAQVGRDWRFAPPAAAVLVIAFALMATAGYLAGTAFMVGGFMLLGRTDWKTAIVFAVLIPVLVWLLFSRLLGYPLP